MISIQIQPLPAERAECPRCRNREGIRDGALSLGKRRKAYDIMSDSWGLTRCPKCNHRGPWADFHRPTTK